MNEKNKSRQKLSPSADLEMSVLKPGEYQATCKRSYTAAETVTPPATPRPPAPALLAGVVGSAGTLFGNPDYILETADVPEFSSLAEMQADCAHRRARWQHTAPGQVTHLPAAGTGLL